MSGESIPRGGERQRPNPLFLAHAAALTELYVTLVVEASAVGLSLFDYRREADAREPFKHLGKERALAPDAMVILADEQERKLGAFVELDLGTMSHARLRQKADLYIAYALADAWHGRHPFLPALLFLTTSDIRARRFLIALDRALSHGPQSYGRRIIVAGAGGLAFAPGRLLGGSCLACLDGDEVATLRNVLNAARAPYDEELAERRREREADDEQCRVLREDPVAMRAHLSKVEHNLGSYLKALGSLDEQTVRLLVASEDRPSPEERRVLSAIARDLDDALLRPGLQRTHPSPGESTISAVRLLAGRYRTAQSQRVQALAAENGEGPRLRKVRRTRRRQDRQAWEVPLLRWQPVRHTVTH